MFIILILRHQFGKITKYYLFHFIFTYKIHIENIMIRIVSFVILFRNKYLN